jgi:hypothetical protein
MADDARERGRAHQAGLDVSEERARPLSPNRKALLIGCIAAFMAVPTVVVVAVLLWHFAQIQPANRAVPPAELNAARVAVHARYGGEVHVVSRRPAGRTRTILAVELLDPPFFEALNPGSAEAVAKAREIAVSCRAALPPQRRSLDVEVTLARGLGPAVTRRYHFRAIDLADAPAPSQ